MPTCFMLHREPVTTVIMCKVVHVVQRGVNRPQARPTRKANKAAANVQLPANSQKRGSLFTSMSARRSPQV